MDAVLGTTFDVRPRSDLAMDYRRRGWWRTGSALTDLQRWREQAPDSLAVMAYRADATTARRLTYAELARYVERFAGALLEMGVRPGQTVAVQMPSWWQFNALVLACARVGAVVAPIMMTIRQRELERVLAATEAVVCVTVDQWEGFGHAKALAEIATRLPALRYRVVLGGEHEPGEIDFGAVFEDAAWEERHPTALRDAVEDPDRVFLVLFTSGTTGEPKAVLHSHNTLYAGTSQLVRIEGLSDRDATMTPHSTSHLAGIVMCVFAPLLVGARSVVCDRWDADRVLDLLADSRTSTLFAAPPFLFEMIAAQRRRPREIPALHRVFSGAMKVPRQLVREMAEAFGVQLRAVWGMTETSAGTWTRRDDPPNWAEHSEGRPVEGTEIELRSDRAVTAEHPGRLHVRGPAVCLAMVGRDSGEVKIIADHDNGWYDTGDLAAPDGRGGIRLMGRTVDRIGGAFMIPVIDVESELLDHPGVDEVALVGYRQPDGTELPCAVVVSRSTSPTLDEVREYLRGKGMTDWYWPTRLEVVPELPRNALGKIRKDLVREWLLDSTST
ncbi:AMP-binding protein [Couchioplanes caeruleus]|uniref:Cyclohexanecarboxylate-CoA ligase n=2 Tax=Couchioplanes caeruleus TaxID=56438 RepID=A0A1K0FDS7_9ACTN|nr:AMP-binding protein [Couchioplanes caeruleus]OJF10989.1 hypothetical protein BG844_29040 [Couchioplanes caeruleus subsp. caeruleus]ROP33541.1 cyclohexanecarboxylate-CoA ligase [Couchioplanes caeruleus]